MVGYEVVTSDDTKVGRVAELRGENLIVEHGTIVKSRHALPKAFAHADDTLHVVRVTVPREILLESPKVGPGGELDEDEVAAHYGLASSADAPPTRGRGEEVPDDPVATAETVAESVGAPDSQERRAAIRRSLDGRGELDESPALLGDRTRHIAGR